MRELRYDDINLTLYQETLDNGLEVYILPKPGFNQTFATFSTRYGSIDREFIIPRTGEKVTVPDGIAHFLEHKMFEEEDGDIFRHYAKYGASANAFTSFDMTTYLFSATSNVKENLEVLLDSVQSVYLTDENVEKEKGIIGQEIRMYDDDPDWRSYFGLLRGMFGTHPIRIDIAGTVESISEITKETLLDCYHTFYHPSNMNLFVVGPVNPQEMVDVIKENQSRKTFGSQGEIERIYPQESPESAEKRIEYQLPVSIPRCLVGFKEVVTADEQLTGRDLIKRELTTAIGFDALFSRSSELFNRLYGEGLIDKGFSWEYEITPAYGFSILGGNTPDPDRLLDILEKELGTIQQNGISEDAFVLSRKKLIGKTIEGLDSPRYLARNVVSYRFRGTDFFESLSILKEITHEEVNRRLAEHFEPNHRTVSVVKHQA